MHSMSNPNLIGNHYWKTSFKGMMKHELGPKQEEWSLHSNVLQNEIYTKIRDCMELQSLKCSFMSHKSDGWFANGQKSSLSNDDDAGARVRLVRGIISALHAMIICRCGIPWLLRCLLTVVKFQVSNFTLEMLESNGSKRVRSLRVFVHCLITYIII